jgi:site-specific recombinase
MKKIWIKKFDSFKRADEADEKYYLKMSSAERLDIMQFLRETYTKLKRGGRHESGQRLRRVIKIFQQA